MSQNWLLAQSIESFIDYENVEPGIGPVEYYLKDHDQFPLTEAYVKPKGYIYVFEEH